MSHLRDQVAIVTGGGSGIGLAITSSLVAEGMGVVIASRNETRLHQAEARLGNVNGKIVVIKTDVSVESQVESLVQQTMDIFGRVDLLVNNAGIGQSALITDCTEAVWDKVLDINLKGAFLCTRAVFPIMKQRRSGYIVNIASVAGKTGFGGASAYCASKFGMVGLTESLLEEAVEYNIKTTAICPGYVATPMVEEASVPQCEMIPPEDIGRLVVVLLHFSPVTVIKEVIVERRGAIGT